MDSFKTSFVQALNSSPTAMCDSCPLRQLHLLCQNLEGVCVCVGVWMGVCVLYIMCVLCGWVDGCVSVTTVHPVSICFLFPS